MIQYREIITCIDSAKGTLVSADGAKINRDEYLPRLILADEVIFIASFVNVKEENNIISVEPKTFNGSLNFRIIGDCDMNNDTAIMFSGTYLPEKSELNKGRIAFYIKSSNTRFYEALNNAKSKKGDFVILAQSADPISTIVLAKDSFIAENRPCENVDFEDTDIEEIITKDELQLLLDLRSPLKHTHSAADITDLKVSENITYEAGNGIDITDNVISADTDVIATREFVTSQISSNQQKPSFSGSYKDLADKPSINGIELDGNITLELGDDSVIYSAGAGILISDNGVISCTVQAGVQQDVFEQTVGNINSILDTINGEEI